MKACFENKDEAVREMVMEIVTTYKPADNSKSVEKDSVYEKLMQAERYSATGTD